MTRSRSSTISLNVAAVLILILWLPGVAGAFQVGSLSPPPTLSYIVDAAATDQGAATSTGNRSLKDFIDAADGHQAVVRFLHYPGTATTTYALGTDETVPSNIHISIDAGAIISIASGVTLTIHHPPLIMAAHDQQIFSGSGAVTFTIGGEVWGGWFGMVGDGATDSTTGWLAWTSTLVSSNSMGRLVNGTFLVSQGVTVTGIQASLTGYFFGITGSSAGQTEWDGTVILWNGTDSSSNTMLKLQGVFRAAFHNITFNGNNKVGKLIHISYSKAPDQYNPTEYDFSRVRLYNTKGGDHSGTWTNVAGAACLYVDGTDNCNRFSFLNCDFGVSTAPIYIENPNSLSHTFQGCTIERGIYGIYINGGSFTAYNCEFAQNYTDDVYAKIHNTLVFINCWTEQSNQFLYTDYRPQSSPIILTGCFISSYPYDFWQRGSRTQPPDDGTQYVAIDWNRPSSHLIMTGTRLFTVNYDGSVVRVWDESSTSGTVINSGSVTVTDAVNEVSTSAFVYTGATADTAGY
jgi:hypothetical protein